MNGDNQIRISPTTDNYLRILGRQIQSESVAPAPREKDNLQTQTIFIMDKTLIKLYVLFRLYVWYFVDYVFAIVLVKVRDFKQGIQYIFPCLAENLLS